MTFTKRVQSVNGRKRPSGNSEISEKIAVPSVVKFYCWVVIGNAGLQALSPPSKAEPEPSRALLKPVVQARLELLKA